MYYAKSHLYMMLLSLKINDRGLTPTPPLKKEWEMDGLGQVLPGALYACPILGRLWAGPLNSF